MHVSDRSKVRSFVHSDLLTFILFKLIFVVENVVGKVSKPYFELEKAR